MQLRLMKMAPAYYPNTETFRWINRSSDEPGVIRTTDLLRYMQEGNESDLVLLFPRRDRPYSPGQVKMSADKCTFWECWT